MPHGYSYMMFSLGGSYALIFGFALAFASSGNIDLHSLSGITIYPVLAYSLMLLGFMTKPHPLDYIFGCQVHMVKLLLIFILWHLLFY